MPKLNWSWLGFSIRPALIGTILFLLALFTWLILLTDSQGTLTTPWIRGLISLFGVGVWLFPLFIGAVGLWLVIHAINRLPDLAWQRPVGCTLFFFAFVIGASLWYSPSQGWITPLSQGGGRLGYFLANMLEETLSHWGAWAFVSFLTLSALTCVFEKYILKAISRIQLLIQQQRWKHQTRTIDPALHYGNSKSSSATAMPQRIITKWRQWIEPVRAMFSVKPNGPKRDSAKPEPSRESRADRQQPPANSGQAQVQPTTPSGNQIKRQQVIQSQMPPADRPQGKSAPPRIVGKITEWRLPIPDDVLVSSERNVENDAHIREQGKLIQDTLAQFGVPVSFEEASIGPTVTQYLIKPGYVERAVRGETKRVKVKVSKIAVLANDLALALAAASVRIEAPIPGTRYVGVEVPNQSGNMVGLKDLMDGEEFQLRRKAGKLPIALGEDVKGNPIVTDLAKMPHLLIAGATGSGKSACINSIITCLLCNHTPDSLRMLMVDPKMVELNIYNGIPHLLSPVVTEVEKAAGVLYWAVKEMERRYSLLSKAGARDLERYNAYLIKHGKKRLPLIVVIVDEMADLMMVAPEDVEKHICRLAQMARAVGIHMIIATQRPSVDVITGLIKANFPARISFAVTSQMDSRVVMDRPGAEALLGKGDMLFMSPDASKLERLQGTYVNDEEINDIAHYWRTEAERMARDLKGSRILEENPVVSANGSAESVSEQEVVQEVIRPISQPALPQPSHHQSPESLQPVPIQQIEPAPSQQKIEPSRRATPAKRTKKSANPKSRAKSVEPLLDKVPLSRTIKGRDDLFEAAVEVVQVAQRGSVSLLQRKLRVGINRANRLVEQLEQAGVLGPDLGEHMGRQVLISNPNAPKLKPRIIGDADDRYIRPPQVWM